MKHLLIVLLLFAGINVYAQKPIIDTAVFNEWPSASRAYLSNDGNYAIYTINKGYSDNYTTVVRSVANGWEKEFVNAREGFFTADSKQYLYTTPGDSICFLTLGSDAIKVIPHAHILANNEKYLAYIADIPKNRLTLLDLTSGREQYVDATGLKDCFFSHDGNILVLQTQEQKDGNKGFALQWFDILEFKSKTIWQGDREPTHLTFNSTGDQLGFTVTDLKDKETELWLYKRGTDSARQIVNDQSPGIEKNLKLSNEPFRFSKDGSRIFFKLVQQHLPQPKPDAIKLDIWNYKDGGLQSDQLEDVGPRLLETVVDTEDGKLIRLQQDDDIILFGEQLDGIFNEHELLTMKFKQDHSDGDEWYWNPNSRPSIILVNTMNGSRKLAKEDAMNFYNYTISTNGRWLVYFDQEQQGYYSFDIESGTTRNLCKNIPINWLNKNEFNGSGTTSTTPTPGLIQPDFGTVGIFGWQDANTLWVYDEYDIWQLDPSGIKRPVNLTNGYGKKHHIRFRVAKEVEGAAITQGDPGQSKLILSAFDIDTKYSGFYQLSQGTKGNPEKLVMGPWKFGDFVKAKEANVWTIRRMSDKEPMNSFVTRDFKSFKIISNVQPQKEYNWLTSELHHWKTPDGMLASGILYKPENFDPRKKYPMLFTYYEKRSDELYEFKDPGWTVAGINIPYFVSRGYLVFEPDIHYKMGETAQSITDCVVSAAKYMTTLPYVDGKKMGIEGQSFGGYETEVLVTHSHLFAAAVPISAPSDLISMYGGIRFGRTRFLGNGIQPFVETSQPRIGATLWQRPDLFIKNSPIFQADRVITPTLIVHGEQDDNVKLEQAIEFYTALRRLGKKVWMLQYNNGTHVIASAKDSRDLTIRLTQFFDHYLKGSPPPKWMTEGVPARLKGIETGLELDTSGKQP